MIQVQALSKKFPGQKNFAVDHVSFQIETGQVACLIGTSGCGKTTTLNMINRLTEPTSGHIHINDHHFSGMTPYKWRRKIGYVVQKAGLLPHLTVKENITLLPKILKRDPKKTYERCQELLELIHLSPQEYENKYPAQLSGGQQQRVGIARALMENPSVLLMDEPFGALDPVTKLSLHNELMMLNEKLHKTILIVTHDINEAFKLGSLIIMMDKGKIIQMGTRDDFMNNPKNDFVKEFIKIHRS